MEGAATMADQERPGTPNLATEGRPLPDVRTGADSDTGTTIPYENTVAGSDDTPVEHAYQTADGTLEVETITAADATFVPQTGNPEIISTPEQSFHRVPEDAAATDATRRAA
jgi:hypothetical protein